MPTLYINTFLVLLRRKFISYMKELKQISFTQSSTALKKTYHILLNFLDLKLLHLRHSLISRPHRRNSGYFKKYHILEKKGFALHLHENTDIHNTWGKLLELEVNHTVLTAWWNFHFFYFWGNMLPIWLINKETLKWMLHYICSAVTCQGCFTRTEPL